MQENQLAICDVLNNENECSEMNIKRAKLLLLFLLCALIANAEGVLKNSPFSASQRADLAVVKFVE